MRNHAFVDQVIDLAIEIQQIPAPTFHEQARASFVHGRFLKEGLSDVITDATGNVYGRLPGHGNKAPLVVSAHLDTVFPVNTPLSVRKDKGIVYGPGIGDNSMGVAGLFGLLWRLRAKKIALPGDLWFVANVGEEGLGNLNGIRAVVERFGKDVLGYIVLEGMALGQIYHQGLGVNRYRITAQTQGGHSWVDYGRPSAIHVLSALVTRLTALQVPEQPRSSLNVGVFTGGTSINTIASKAELELDLRSESQEVLLRLSNEVEALVAELNHTGVTLTAEPIGQRPSGSIPVDHPLVRAAVQSLESLGIKTRYNVGSTDANIPLSQGIPAICLGLTTGNGAHTVNEYIYIQPLQQGLDQLERVVTAAFYEM